MISGEERIADQCPEFSQATSDDLVKALLITYLRC
jgi:hypothetical protein